MGWRVDDEVACTTILLMIETELGVGIMTDEHQGGEELLLNLLLSVSREF